MKYTTCNNCGQALSDTFAEQATGLCEECANSSIQKIIKSTTFNHSIMTLEEAMQLVKPGQEFYNKNSPEIIYSFHNEIDSATINVKINMSDHAAKLPYKKASCAEFFESGAWVAK